jgi:hypothetical protein
MKNDIRETLMNEIDSLLSGKSDIKRARAISKLSAQVIYKDRLTMESKVLEAKSKLWFGGKK